MWRTRVIGLEFHRAGDLLDHPLQWKIHPDYQRAVVRGILDEIGIADVLLAYHSEQAGGELVKVDGHARGELDPEQVWPVIVLDLTDDEAAKLLALHDRTAAMSATDGELLAVLLEQIEPSEDEAVSQLLSELAQEASQTELGQYGGSSRDINDHKTMIRAVIYAEDVLDFERAILATGEQNRGRAIAWICRHYLESINDDGNTEGQHDAALESLLAASSAA